MEGSHRRRLPPRADVSNWHARSPVFRITRTSAPLLLLVSENDLRHPPILDRFGR